VENERLLKVGDVAQILRVAPITVKRWAREGVLPHVKFPRAVRFRRDDLEKVIEERRRGGRRQ
jgi:excisionase family DNA binding protein